MSRREVREIPEQAAHCLNCACLNEENDAARELLFTSDATSAAGVIAAAFIAAQAEHSAIIDLARQAILQQRDSCRRHGPFRPDQCQLYRGATG